MFVGRACSTLGARPSPCHLDAVCPSSASLTSGSTLSPGCGGWGRGRGACGLSLERGKGSFCERGWPNALGPQVVRALREGFLEEATSPEDRMVGEVGQADRSSRRKPVWRRGQLCIRALCIRPPSGCGHL